MIELGLRMPFCAGMDADRQFYSFDAQAGRAAVLLLSRTPHDAAAHQLVYALARLRPELAALDTDLVLMAPFNTAATVFHAGPGAEAGLSIVVCHDGLFEACAVPEATPLVVVIDRASRIRMIHGVDDAFGPPVAHRTLQAVQGLAREPAGAAALPAPVLTIPGLLEQPLCHALIEHFESGASFDSGVTGSDLDGQTRHRLDHDRKRRRDCLLQPGDDLHDAVHDRLFRRCAPEIRRAFHHDIAHADRILVARYDAADGGHFRRHRDNAAPGVAFRQFALSINLNTGAYDGGHLLFPEYNDHRYRPQTGEGIVFSASLLHEATPVTIGYRYVLLTFLHDEQAEIRRLT